MADMKEYAESEFVTVEFVKNLKSNVGRILDPGTATLNDKGQKRMQFRVHVGGKEKKYSPNKSTVELWGERLGWDSNNYVGRLIEFELFEYKGKDAIMAVPKKTSTDDVPLEFIGVKKPEGETQ